MAIYLYSQDYNGTYFYSVGSRNYNDGDSPYARYFGGTVALTTMRTARVCPAVAARMGTDQFTYSYVPHTCSMPVAMIKMGGRYVAVMTDLNGFIGFNLRTPPYPSQYLLMIDSRGNTLKCGGLVSAVTTINSSSGDSMSAIDRYRGGGVNCLFGDFHVEFVSSQTISNQDAVNCNLGNPWFMMN